MQLSWEQFEEICRPVGLTAKQELKAYNIIREYEAISNFTEKTKFDLGKMFILKYIMVAVKHDAMAGDYADNETRKMIRKAGELLNEYDGMSAMHDVLLTWVPYRYRAEISLIWDGIDGWRA